MALGEVEGSMSGTAGCLLATGSEELLLESSGCDCEDLLTTCLPAFPEEDSPC